MVRYCQVRQVTGAPARREATRDGILEAALRCFARDGYRRTAMDRVAREAGVSRAAVYLHFPNKEALFRALVGGLYERALEAATTAASSDADLVTRIFGILEAKSVRFFELLRGSAHAEEFLGENHRLCGDLSARAAEKYRRILSRTLAGADASGQISLAAAELKPAQAADLLLDMADGIKTRARASMTTAAYVQRLENAVRILLTGLELRI